MAKKTAKKKVVTSVKKAPTPVKSTLNPTTSRTKSKASPKVDEPLLFAKQNYILILAGVLIMALGFILMLGGDMPDPNTWDEDIIYGFRRTVLAPFVILAGLITLVFAVFKKQTVVNKNL